ncbi:MAG: hypothetical protein R3F34_20170 [Planctomycetota bacterium]
MSWTTSTARSPPHRDLARGVVELRRDPDSSPAAPILASTSFAIGTR